MKHFLHELQRRNVHRVAIFYLAGGWLLLQVADVLAEIYGLEGATLQWLVALLAGGFLPALALAWIFEWTSRGLRREAQSAGGAEPPRARSRIGDRIIIALLAAALSVLVADRFLISPPEAGRSEATDAGPSIAVLPFLDLSPEGNQGYLASGIAEEMLGLLARLEGLRVAARTSSFSFGAAAVPVAEIGEKLNVRYVLEGSVNAAGDRVRIRVRLVDTRTGFQIWSSSYDSRGGTLFDVQDDVADQVARALELEILGETPRVYRTDPDAHRLVMEAQYLQAQASPASMRLAVAKLEQAIGLDAAYPPAWTALSGAYANMAAEGVLDWDDGHRRAKEAAENALELDRNAVRALDRLAWHARTYEGNLLGAARYLERALVLAPTDPDLIGHAAVLLQSLGRLDEAVALHEYSAEQDPVDTRGLFNLALAYYFAGRLNDAARVLDRVLVLAPGYLGARYRLGAVRLLQGRDAEALAQFDREEDDEYRTKGRALALFTLGRRAEADAAVEELTRRWGEQWPSEVAQVHAWRRELDRAFAWLEKDYEVAGAAGWGEWRLMPLYRNLHGDPRWNEFLNRVGAADEQLAAVPLRLPPGTLAAVRASEVPRPAAHAVLAPVPG